MMVRDIIKAINSLSDDQIPDEEVLSFVNDAMVVIGQDQYATFPVLETVYDEPAIPEKWQRLLLIPFGKGRVKEKDSSQFEWESGYDQFYNNLLEFNTSYEVPKQYKDLKVASEISINGTVFEVESGDTLTAIARQNGVSVQDILDENGDTIEYVSSAYESNIYKNRPGMWGGISW